MKIVADETIMNIDFVETMLTSNQSHDGLFSFNVDLTTAAFHGRGENIWFSLEEYEQFINALKAIDKNDAQPVMFQTTIEANEYYRKVGDHLNISFMKRWDDYVQCHATLSAYPKNRPDRPYSYTQMFIHSFGLDISAFSNMITNFETLKTVITQDLEQRVKEEKYYD
jgi:hypothetical protein